MSTQRLVWEDGFRFTGTDSWGHTVSIDGDPGGAGSKPSDLMALSLAACTAYDVVNILRKQRQDLRALEAEIISTQDADAPWTYRAIEVRFVARGPVDPAKARKALALSEEKYCAISATLRPSVRLSFVIEVEPAG